MQQAVKIGLNVERPIFRKFETSHIEITIVEFYSQILKIC